MVSIARNWTPLAAVVAGVLLSLCYPTFDHVDLVWIALLPLMAALWLGPEPPGIWSGLRRGFGLGYMTGFVFFLINLKWIHTVTSAGGIVLPAYLALYPALWGAIAATAGRPAKNRLTISGETKGWRASVKTSCYSLRCAFINAGLWAGLEWLRGSLFSGFGWNGLGIPLHERLVLAQIADIIGVTGLSFIVVFFTSILFTTGWRIYLEVRSMRLRPHLDFSVTLLGMVLVAFYGISRLTAVEGKSIDFRCLLVQLNIPQEEKWDETQEEKIRREYGDLTELYVSKQPFDLVLWPETSITGFLHYQPNPAYLSNLLSKGNFNLLLGIQEFDPETEGYYNTAALLEGDYNKMQIYRKRHLVPFGEFIPFRDSFPPFEWIAGELIPEDFDAGVESDPMKLAEKGIEIIPLICFEDTVGDLPRKAISNNPQVIVNLTNDGWFGQSEGSRQHLVNACFRAIELRRPLLRAANTGVSCYVDPYGRRVREIVDDLSGSHFVKGFLPLTVTIPTEPKITFFARFGNLFTAVVALISGLLSCLFFFTRRI